MNFEVTRGDITAVEADAIVNAANTDIQMGGGVAAAIRQAAGEEIQQEANAKAPIDLGGATWTEGYDLDADYVIHAATMHLDRTASESSVRSATRNALRTADDLGCRSIVLPALGCGTGGLDIEEGARYIFEEIRRHEPRTLQDVRVIGHSERDFRTLGTIGDTVGTSE